MNFIISQIDFIKNYGFSYIEGAFVTIELSLIGVFFGFIIGLIISLMKISEFKPFKIFASAYIEIIRGTPMLVQLFIFYFGLKAIIPANMDFLKNSIFLCSIAICINSSAYIAEVIRTGINSVDKGQLEAARSLGLSYKQSLKYVIIPQGIKTIIPSLGNEFIALIKETSIVLTVGVADLTYQATIIKGATFEAIRPFIYVGIFYFVLTFSLSKLIAKIERSL